MQWKKALVLECVLCIHYPVQFKKDANGTHVQALINSVSKVNAMTLAYTSKLGLWVYPTNVGVKKIDGSTLQIFGIVQANF